MAEETNNNSNDPIDPNDMESQGQTGGDLSAFSPDQTNEIFTEHGNKLGDPIKDAENEAGIRTTEYEAKKVISNYKQCAYEEAVKAYREYSKICICISTYLEQDVTQINGNVGSYIDQSQGFSTYLSASLDKIKEMKKKMLEVNDAAYKLRDALKDSCNSEQKKILIRGLPGTDDEPSFLEAAKDIIEQASVVCSRADDVFETGVKVAGINAFTNVESLKEFGTTLVTCAGGFNKDVKSNVTFTSEQMTAALDDLSAALQEESIAESEKYKALLAQSSLEDTRFYVLSENKIRKSCARFGSIIEICGEVENTFDDDTC